MRVKEKQRKNITATKNSTNLPTVRLKIWKFLRAGLVTRSEDICDCRVIKNQSDSRFEYRKTTKSRNSSFSFIASLKIVPIFSEFTQELYYAMLKQIPVTVCHNSG